MNKESRLLELFFLGLMFIVAFTVIVATSGCGEVKTPRLPSAPAATIPSTTTPNLEIVCTDPQVSLICANGFMFGMINGLFKYMPNGSYNVQGTWDSECKFAIIGCEWIKQ